MFEGEKTALFWVGLLILSFATVGLFALIWSLVSFNMSYPAGDLLYTFRIDIPIIFGAVVFILVGLYMMKEGAKKTSSTQQKLPSA